MAESGSLSFDRKGAETLTVHLTGSWTLHGHLPSTEELERELGEAHPRRVAFESGDLDKWDTALLTFLQKTFNVCRERKIDADRDGLPKGVQRLLELAEAVPEAEGARRSEKQQNPLARLGIAARSGWKEAREFLAFVGEATIALGSVFTGRARYRFSDVLVLIQRCGADALPIVTLISFLVGLILACVGAVQLQLFGAEIYVADLVGIAIVRDMGAMMTAIVMAGRTGAAFAAELGTMKVTQEIDAFRTMGINPMEFLVVPRMIALFLMMPLLCLYSDFIGILGGAAVGLGMLDLSWTTYYQQTTNAVTLAHLIGGLVKAATYGALVALSGCLRGMQCGKSSLAVGEAATSAVVTGIVLIVSACGVYAVAFYIWGI